MTVRRQRVTAPELEPFIVREVEQTGATLGAGAYGSVVEVKIAGTSVAAKKLHDGLVQFGSDEQVRTWVFAFVAECTLLALLLHPNIVQFLGVCYLPDSHLPVLLMEKLQTSLDNLLETNANIPIDLKLSLLIGTARGLIYLHSRIPPIAHRDLTARNVLVNSGLEAKIADLGMAKMMMLQPGQLSATMTNAPGNILYMPPEALSFGVRPTRYGTSIDIFSFGVISLFTLTQTFPKDLKPATYLDPTTQRIVALTEIERREEYVQMMHTTLGETHPLVELTLGCLAFSHEDRPSANDILLRLEYVQDMPALAQSMTKLEQIYEIDRINQEKVELRNQLDHLQQQVEVLELQMPTADNLSLTRRCRSSSWPYYSEARLLDVRPSVSRQKNVSTSTSNLSLNKSVSTSTHDIHERVIQPAEARNRSEATGKLVQFREEDFAVILDDHEVRSNPSTTATDSSTVDTANEGLFDSSDALSVSNYEPLGRPGGFGQVYKINLPDGRVLAGKAFHDHIVAFRPNFNKSMETEMAILKGCNHEHIVKYYGSCHIPQLSCERILLMEIMDIDFQEYYTQHSNLSLHNISEILIQVARGLDYLHMCRPKTIIHRDLSARNVLLNKAISPPHAKITDFGNSRFSDSIFTIVSMSQMLGTRYYLAPEVDCNKAHYNVKVDVFSFGHLSLSSAIQQVIASLPDVRVKDPSGMLIARTEVEIREEYFEILRNRIGRDTMFETLVKQCLSFEIVQRPSAHKLVDQLTAILAEPCETLPCEHKVSPKSDSTLSTDSSRGIN